MDDRLAIPPAAPLALLRELTPQVVGAIARRFGDFAAAEDAVQEALLAAATEWPRQGVPDNPRGWLIQVASRRMTDHVRREIARRRREAIVVSLVPAEIQLALGEVAETWGDPVTATSSEAAPPGHRASGGEGEPELASDGDDTLALIFLCCHPALTTSSAVALTLRAVGGLTTAEIARAFLVPEATMAQRISRAKQSIKSSGVPFAMPSVTERKERLSAVLHVLYLVFSEGYASSGGAELQRADLAREAIRLTRLLRALAPDQGEVTGLLALMLLTDARRAARVGRGGELIPLDQQDRATWDGEAITEGVALLTAVLPRGTPGPYQLQAAIAAVHDEAERVEDTDWRQILALYDILGQLSDNPMVVLNRAVALAMVEGPAAGLAQLRALEGDPRVASHHRLAAVRGHLLERAGDLQGAAAEYRLAAGRTSSLPERHYLLTRAARLTPPPS